MVARLDLTSKKKAEYEEDTKMKTELTREELEMVNGGVWDVIIETMKHCYEVVEEKYIDPLINEAKLATKVVVNDVVDEVVELGDKIYDVI